MLNFISRSSGILDEMSLEQAFVEQIPWKTSKIDLQSKNVLDFGGGGHFILFVSFHLQIDFVWN